MTTFDRFDPFERRIGEALDGLAPLRRPEYLSDLLEQTARTRQRPRWSFPERWLPVDIALNPGLWRRNPLRLVVVVLLLAALATALWVGSRLVDQPHVRLPAPFGPARNGLVVFGVGPDIFLGDPVTESSRLLAAGVGSHPVWDRSGTRVATARTSPAGVICYGPPPVPACTVDIVITNAAGESVIATREPLPYPAQIRDWSPDDQWILLTVGSTDAMELVAADGSGSRGVPAFSNFVLPRFAPPDGASIWIAERATMGGLIPMRIGLGGEALTRFTAIPGRENLVFDASPGGERLAFAGTGSTVDIGRLDGSIERTIELGADVEHVSGVAWSPAGDSLLVEVFRRGSPFTVLLVDPSGAAAPVALDPRVQGTCSWAPDGGSLLCWNDVLGWLIFDRLTGISATGWGDASYPPTWQRLPIGAPR